MTESIKTKLESSCMLVDSDYFPDTIYAIDRKGRGIHILCGDRELIIAADQVHTFAAELVAVWDALRPRTVMK